MFITPSIKKNVHWIQFGISTASRRIHSSGNMREAEKDAPKMRKVRPSDSWALAWPGAGGWGQTVGRDAPYLTSRCSTRRQRSAMSWKALDRSVRVCRICSLLHAVSPLTWVSEPAGTSVGGRSHSHCSVTRPSYCQGPPSPHLLTVARSRGRHHHHLTNASSHGPSHTTIIPSHSRRLPIIRQLP